MEVRYQLRHSPAVCLCGERRTSHRRPVSHPSLANGRIIAKLPQVGRRARMIGGYEDAMSSGSSSGSGSVVAL
jgi:Asp-tRNA(Asn)/Glu-tRNA(Gln) amidotransferase A subunit family amidase